MSVAANESPKARLFLGLRAACCRFVRRSLLRRTPTARVTRRWFRGGFFFTDQIRFVASCVASMRPEEATRQQKIDLQLGRAGWSISSRQLIQEFLVSSPSILRTPETPYRAKNEFADYALLDRLGRPLAIVEAKRQARNPIEAERQAADYAD